MSPQTFQSADLVSVVFLVLLEAALSADNALVLAVLVKPLPKEQQKKALLYGLGGALLFRLIAILLATLVLKLWWLQALGGAYLLFVPFKSVLFGSRHDTSPKSGLWQTIIAVELTDIVFAIDSVLAGVGFINNQPDKIWVVYFGAIIGIVCLRFVATGLVKLLDRYPIMDKVAYAIVFWVGVKLCWLALSKYQVTNAGHSSVGEMPEILFWVVLVALAFGGGILAFAKRKPGPKTDPSD